MADKSLTTEQVLTILTETPHRITALTSGLLPVQLHTASEHDAWSVNDVLAHLRACADVWGNCIVTIIAQDKPTLRAVNPTTWINQTDYPQQEFQPSFQAFTAQRSDLLAVLEVLTPEGWSRTATITGAGKALERSVLSYAQWMARHERSHFKQIENIVNATRI